MKKLLIALAAAATTAFGAFADGDSVLTGTAFGVKDATLVEATKLSDVTLLGLTGDETGFWSGIVDDIKVTPWGEETAQDQLQRFKEADLLNVNYLAVKTTFGSPLFRNVKADASAHDVATAGAIYFEGNVKFTACDEDPDFKADAYEGAKLFIYVKDANGGEGEPENHLYVKVGQTGTAYDCGVDAVLVDEWQKLTIKALEITADHQLGFLINVNDKAITCTGVVQPQGLTNIAQSYADANRLFPSSITSGGAISTIEGIGFDGQGALDQIAFTQEDLIPDPQFAKLTFNAGTPATIDELSIYENGDLLKTFTASPAEFEIDPDKDYTYTYKAKTGYIDVTTPQELDFSESKELSIKDADPLAAMLALNDGEAVPYSTIKAAIDKINEEGEKTAVLTLKANAPAIEIDNADATVVIDLAGCNVTATTDDDAAIWVETGSVMITNSTEKIGHVIGYDGNAAVDYNDADEVVITAGYYDGGAYPTLITGGAFDNVGNTLEDLDSVKQDGFKFVDGEGDDAGYYVLVPDLSVKVTFADGTNCTVTKVDGEDYEAGTELKFEKGATAKVTYEAVEGFTFTDGTEVTVDVEITEAGEIPAQVSAFAAVAKIGDNAFYPTIEDAVAAAEANATITLLADCAITKKEGETYGLVIDKNLTIDAAGDYTLTGPFQQYGILVRDGATLTLAGGTITPDPTLYENDKKEMVPTSNTILNIGIHEGAEATWTTGNLVLAGGTIKGNGVNGNAIAAQAGTVTINSGSIINIGSRGLKAECIATAVINGGTIGDANTGDKPVLYVADAGAITVNGGDFCGKFDKNSKATGTITIPGLVEGVANAATFDQDQSAYCDPKGTYKTKVVEPAIRYTVVEIVYGGFTVQADEGVKSYVLSNATAEVTDKYTADIDLAETITAYVVEFNDGKELDADNSTLSVVLDSTEAKKIVIATKSAVKPVDPVDPEQPKSYDTPAEAEAAAKAINDNKETYINSPEDAPDGFNKAAYVENFEAVVGENNTVVVQLTEKAQADLQAQVNSDVVTKIKPAELAAADGEATLVTTPGFYYTVVAGDGIGTMAPKSCTFAETAETEVALPSFKGAGFYTIKVTVKRVEIE